MKALPWSHSSLESFKNCPKQYYHLKVLKDVKDSPGEAAMWGDRVHKAFEKYLNDCNMIEVAGNTGKVALPEVLENYRTVLDDVMGLPGRVIAEQQLALNKDMVPCGWTDPDVWCRGIVDILVIDGHKAWVGDWKGLALDTPIPTPSGWTTMGDLSEGDIIFGGDGKPCTVVGKSGVHHRTCHELRFDSEGDPIVCDDEHLWVTNGKVKSAADIARTVRTRKGQAHHKIPLHPGLDLPEQELLVPPYVLGAWLGNGKHTSGEICKPDQELWENIAACGYALSHDYSEKAGKGAPMTRTVFGLSRDLKRLGVHGNKHIPAQYLRGSHQQRLQLLQGLMDTDGNANTVRGQAIFSTCDKGLSDSVRELLISLGQRPNQWAGKGHGFGLEVDVYPIAFRPQGIKPFTLTRKQGRVDGLSRGNSWRRVVVSADVAPTVPTQCIAVDSSDNTYLCGRDMVITHNTGKNRKPSSRQLMLFALLVFAHYPEIEVCKTSFLWLKFKDDPKGYIDTEMFHREEAPELWQRFLPDLKAFVTAFKTEVFNPRQSGLCWRWCSVVSCQHNGKNPNRPRGY